MQRGSYPQCGKLVGICLVFFNDPMTQPPRGDLGFGVRQTSPQGRGVVGVEWISPEGGGDLYFRRETPFFPTQN